MNKTNKTPKFLLSDRFHGRYTFPVFYDDTRPAGRRRLAGKAMPGGFRVQLGGAR